MLHITSIEIVERAPCTPSFWTEPRIKELAVLWNDKGYTSSQCGKEFGVTRSAIIGAIHRHGGKYGVRFDTRSPGGGRPRSTTAAAKPARIKPLKRTAPRINVKLEAERQELKLTEAVDLVAAVSSPVGQRCTIYQLNPFTCRWPIGENEDLPGKLFYCGAQAYKVYCRGHFKMSRR